VIPRRLFFPGFYGLPGLLFLLLIGLPSAWGALPIGPEQPEAGFGGRSYPHGGWQLTRFNSYEDCFFIGEPTEPVPASAPVVVFLHGWMNSDPREYEGWLQHLCRRGWIVIFPRYQGTGESHADYTLNAIRSVKEAWRTIYDRKRITPDRERTAIIGHQCGAVVGANIAATHRHFKIAPPRALLLLSPSRFERVGAIRGLDLYDLSGIPAGTLMLVGVGEMDAPETEPVAKDLFYGADQVRSADKNFLMFLNDLHGTPPLIADRFATLAPVDPLFERVVEARRHTFINTFPQAALARHIRCRGIDALDWNGTFRLFDALAHAAFTGARRAEALGNTELQREMGSWSDGRPINRPLVTERP
jgi:acetyl esterase/lipase